jgi:hypothetical protein
MHQQTIYGSLHLKRLLFGLENSISIRVEHQEHRSSDQGKCTTAHHSACICLRSVQPNADRRSRKKAKPSLDGLLRMFLRRLSRDVSTGI